MPPLRWLKTAGVPSLLLALVIVVANAALAYRTWVAFNRGQELARQTELVGNNTRALLSSLKDAETGERGYILTGHDEYLEPYRIAKTDIPSQLLELEKLTRGTPEAAQLESLTALVKERIEVLDGVVSLRRSQGAAAATAAIQGGAGKAAMARIRTLGAEMTERSEQRLSQATDAAQSDARLLELLTLLGGLVVFTILAFSTIAVRRGAQRNEDLIQELRKHEDLLTNFVLHVPAAISMLDRDWRYLQVSNLWCTNYRRDRELVLGRNFFDVGPDLPEPERWLHRFHLCLAGEAWRADEEPFQRPDGSPGWLRMEIRPWGNRGGHPEGVLVFSEDITERKQAEAALREQHERLEKIAATAPGALWSFRMRPDGSTAVPYASPGFGQMLPELPDLTDDADPFFTAVHPDDAQRVQASVAESARLMTAWRASYRIQTGAGGERWLEGHQMPTREPDGTINWYGFLTDVTDRVTAEQAVESARQDYRTLIDNSPDAVSRFNPEARHTLVNRRILDVTGLQPEAMLGKTVDELFPASFSGPWTAALRRVIASGEQVSATFTFPTAAGETFWDFRMVPEFGKNGALASVLAIGHDVTERRRAEAIAAERFSMIEMLFHTTSEAIIGADAKNEIQLVNRVAEEMFGYEPNRLVGALLETLLPLDARPDVARLGASQELEGRRKDGSRFPIEVKFTQLKTNGGPMAVSFVIDITARKQNEQSLRKAIQDLRKLSVALITAEDNAARQIARELHDDISQRLAFLSMEIGKAAANTPPEDGERVKELRSYQAKIRDVSEGIRRISHRMHPSILEDLGLSAALESICLDLQRAEGTRVRFEARGVPETIDRTIASCLYRVGQESLRNVSKHAHAPDVEVVLSCDGESIELTIADTGTGYDTATKKGGLGTHSVQERVGLVNGTVAVQSEPGRGTRVVARVPLRGGGVSESSHARN